MHGAELEVPHLNHHGMHTISEVPGIGDVPKPANGHLSPFSLRKPQVLEPALRPGRPHRRGARLRPGEGALRGQVPAAAVHGLSAAGAEANTPMGQNPIRSPSEHPPRK